MISTRVYQAISLVPPKTTSMPPTFCSTSADSWKNKLLINDFYFVIKVHALVFNAITQRPRVDLDKKKPHPNQRLPQH